MEGEFEQRLMHEALQPTLVVNFSWIENPYKNF